MKDLFATGRDWQANYRMRHRDGSWRHLEGHAALVRGGLSGVELAIVVARDITERVAADLERVQDHAIKNLILEHSNLGIVFVRNRVFEWVNTRWGDLGRPWPRSWAPPPGSPTPTTPPTKHGATTYPAMAQGGAGGPHLADGRGTGPFSGAGWSVVP